ERLWYVQRAGDELFTPAAGYGLGRNVAESVWQNEQTNKRTLGSDPRLRGLLGALPGTGIQPPDNAGHSSLRLKFGARICHSGRFASPRAKPEARVQGTGRTGRRRDSRIVSDYSVELCAGEEQFRNCAGDQWPDLRRHHYIGR